MNRIRNFINKTHDDIVDDTDHSRINLIALTGVTAIFVTLALVLVA